MMHASRKTGLELHGPDVTAARYRDRNHKVAVHVFAFGRKRVGLRQSYDQIWFSQLPSSFPLRSGREMARLALVSALRNPTQDDPNLVRAQSSLTRKVAKT